MSDEEAKGAQNSQSSSQTDIQRTTPLIYNDEDFDPVYLAKARILNDALEEIGMGKYQWGLFAVLGGGWLADTLWPLVVQFILPAIVREFSQEGNPFNGSYVVLGQHIGLLVGVIFWGIGSDVWGRRISFNITLGVTGIFAIAGLGARTGVTLASLAAVWSTGVGGNLPVDSAIFLEAVPPSRQYLLSTLSIWWSVGSLIASLVSWPLLTDFSCPTEESVDECNRGNNQGWRYLLFTMGGLMLLLWGIRFFAFKLYQLPKFEMGNGDDEGAVNAVHKIAAYNGKTSSLTLQRLQEAGKMKEVQGRQAIAKSTFSHVATLFASKRVARATVTLILLWACIGAATTLYNTYMINYLASRGAILGQNESAYTMFRNQIITAVIGIPGAIVAGMLVNVPFLGRRGTLAVAAILTGVFTFASTTGRTESATLGFNCAYIFTYNIMNGVLHALTAEIFPTQARGTGNAVAATSNRIFGIMGPLLSLHANLDVSAPIWVAGALYIISAVIVLLVPFEPRGKGSA